MSKWLEAEGRRDREGTKAGEGGGEPGPERLGKPC